MPDDEEVSASSVLVPFFCAGGARRKSVEGETKDYMEPQVGSILEGKVTTITKFGAFVALEGGRSGLVHISEIANTFVNDVHDFLQEGQTVKVLVLSTANGKINPSIKKTQPQERPAPRTPDAPPCRRPRGSAASGPAPDEFCPGTAAAASSLRGPVL